MKSGLRKDLNLNFEFFQIRVGFQESERSFFRNLPNASESADLYLSDIEKKCS